MGSARSRFAINLTWFFDGIWILTSQVWTGVRTWVRNISWMGKVFWAAVLISSIAFSVFLTGAWQELSRVRERSAILDQRVQSATPTQIELLIPRKVNAPVYQTPVVHTGVRHDFNKIKIDARTATKLSVPTEAVHETPVKEVAATAIPVRQPVFTSKFPDLSSGEPLRPTNVPVHDSLDSEILKALL